MTIRTFKNADLMFSYLQSLSDEAAEATEKSEIKPEDLRHGDYAVSIREDMGVIIFGEVIEQTDYPEDNETIERGRERGWIFGKWYSVMCVDGELGDTHISRIDYKISKDEFEEAKASGWNIVL